MIRRRRVWGGAEKQLVVGQHRAGDVRRRGMDRQVRGTATRRVAGVGRVTKQFFKKNGKASKQESKQASTTSRATGKDETRRNNCEEKKKRKKKAGEDTKQKRRYLRGSTLPAKRNSLYTCATRGHCSHATIFESNTSVDAGCTARAQRDRGKRRGRGRWSEINPRQRQNAFQN